MISDPVVDYRLGEFSFGELLELNACTDARDTVQLAPNASCTIAPDCADGSTTELCSVSDLGHRWPGGATDPDGPFRVTDAVWEFLAGFSS